MSGPGEGSEFTREERAVIEFLRTSKRVDVRWLSGEQKSEIRRVMDQLHNGKKLSLFRISKEVGMSSTAIWGLLQGAGCQHQDRRGS